MSLRVWLPLTKDLRNQGLDDVTVTNNGATFNANGKLGGCYEFTSGKRIQTTLPASTSLNAKAISFACWIYVTSWNSSYDCFMSIADNTYWNTSRATLCRNSTASTLVWNIADGTNRAYVTTTTALSLNTWTHVVGTYDGTNLKIYINGVLNNTSATTLSIGYAGTFNIGGWSGNNYPFNGYLNDVRIYNHCLSPLEVKQISQGLILHYPLNRGGFGQENLLKGTDTGSGWSYSTFDVSKGVFTRSTTSTSESYVQFNGYNVPVEAGVTYTLSCYAKSNGFVRGMDMYKYNSSVQNIQHTSYDLTIDYKLYTFTFTPQATENVTIRFDNNGSTTSGTEAIMYIKRPKLEKGSIATPWCPNSSDALATTMGLNDNVEYDTSGYGNNGTKVGTLDYDSDTPKYNVSTEFNGSNTCIYLNDFVLGNEWSYGMWFYHPTRDGTWTTITILNNTGSDSDTQFSFWYNNNENRFQSTANTQYNSAIPAPTKDVWHHFFATFDGNILITYIDGVVINTKTITTKLTQKPHLTIGGRRSGENRWDYYWKGKMSDYRVYCTALSADDVKSLYNNSAYIDNQGNIYGAVYEEV